MFDFSMAGVDVKDTEAGTPPYLDPFLGQRRAHPLRHRRRTLRRGGGGLRDGRRLPARRRSGPGCSPGHRRRRRHRAVDMFDPAIADGLVAFFTAALSREVTRRPDTAEDMLLAWQRVFDTAAPQFSPQDSETAATKAALATPLAEAGLTPRAVLGAGRCACLHRRGAARPGLHPAQPVGGTGSQGDPQGDHHPLP